MKPMVRFQNVSMLTLLNSKINFLRNMNNKRLKSKVGICVNIQIMMSRTGKVHSSSICTFYSLYFQQLTQTLFNNVICCHIQVSFILFDNLFHNADDRFLSMQNGNCLRRNEYCANRCDKWWMRRVENCVAVKSLLKFSLWLNVTYVFRKN